MKRFKRLLATAAVVAAIFSTATEAEARCARYMMWNDANCTYGCTLSGEGDGYCWYSCPVVNC